MRKGLVTVDLLVTALFAYAAFVQWNDPDPVRWIAIYMAAALLSLASAAGRPVPWQAPAALGLVALVWAATLAPNVLRYGVWGRIFETYEMRDLEVEETRELLGLVVVATLMGVLGWRCRRPTRWAGEAFQARG